MHNGSSLWGALSKRAKAFPERSDPLTGRENSVSHKHLDIAYDAEQKHHATPCGGYVHTSAFWKRGASRDDKKMLAKER